MRYMITLLLAVFLSPLFTAEKVAAQVNAGERTMDQENLKKVQDGRVLPRAGQSAHQVRHVSVHINRPVNEVYAFASDPANLPKWATGLGGTIRQVNGEWIADAPMGRVKIRFAERNKFGVLDHDVVLESGAVVHNPMRVVPCGSGSEVTFMLKRREGITDAEFSADADWVERDLTILRDMLERQTQRR